MFFTHIIPLLLGNQIVFKHIVNDTTKVNEFLFPLFFLNGFINEFSPLSTLSIDFIHWHLIFSWHLRGFLSDFINNSTLSTLSPEIILLNLRGFLTNKFGFCWWFSANHFNLRGFISGFHWFSGNSETWTFRLGGLEFFDGMIGLNSENDGLRGDLNDKLNGNNFRDFLNNGNNFRDLDLFGFWLCGSGLLVDWVQNWSVNFTERL